MNSFETFQEELFQHKYVIYLYLTVLPTDFNVYYAFVIKIFFLKENDINFIIYLM